MESLSNLLFGLEIALSPNNLLFAVVGSALGMLVGVLPGLGPAAATALLLPITFRLDTTGSIIMLAAIYYGSQFGGTITSVLLNLPGEASSAVTCIDGHPMAKNGRAGTALSIAAIGSAIGGILAAMGLVLAAPLLAGLALRFGPPEQFALMVFATALLLGLAGNSLLKALMMGAFGLLLATIGLDPTEGRMRFTFEFPELFDGLSFVPVVMGLFGLADILIAVENIRGGVQVQKVARLLPTREDLRASVRPVLRGTGIGFVLGLIPGMMPSVSSFLSYIAEKTVSKTPGRFGHGAIEGVAGPETANNAHATSSLIPLLTLGIPATPTIAVILGAFLVKGLVPGPLLFRDNPEIVWGVIASFFVGNIILLLWNIPLLSIWTAILKIPQSVLICVILMFMIVGAYSEYGGVFGVGILLISGCVGYALKKLDFPIAPLILALVIGPMMEQTLVRSLEMFSGDMFVFLTRPITLTLLAAAAGVVMMFTLHARNKPKELLSEDGE